MILVHAGRIKNIRTVAVEISKIGNCKILESTINCVFRQQNVNLKIV